LNPIAGNSSIGPAHLTCEVTGFRAVRAGNDTGVDAICSYRRDLLPSPFDRVRVYREISNMTNGITILGPYTLDKDSLYVNGYNEAPALPSESIEGSSLTFSFVISLFSALLPSKTPTSAIERFTVNFTITNLKYASDMGTPHSTTFNATVKAMVSLLNPIAGNSSIGPAHLTCEVTGFRAVRAGNDTGVDAICSYRRDLLPSPFERVRVYREISNMTNGITMLGPYTLDRNSLYVSVCAQWKTVMPPTIPASTFDSFTVNFTITNLQYSSQLGIQHSKTFNATETVFTSLLDLLMKNSSIGPVYIACKVVSYWPVNNGDDTRVDAFCTYRNESTMSRFDRVKVYHELSNKTNGITKLGPYILDNNSLYVNGYNAARPLPKLKSCRALTTVRPATTLPPSAAPDMDFTVNFTITNLPYNSKTVNATNNVLTLLLDRLLRNSSIGPAYTGCKVMALRPLKNQDGTGMDAICTYRNESAAPTFDRVKLYHELSSMTNGTTTLGPYRLDNSSLYVNASQPAYSILSLFSPQATMNHTLGQVIVTPATQMPPLTTEHFTLNITVTNLRFTTDLGMPGSPKFTSTEKVMLHYINPLLKNSRIGPDYIGWLPIFSSLKSLKNRDDTGVDAVCSYRNHLASPRFGREKVYHELSNMTKNITQLGLYTLDNTSLYVNGNQVLLVFPCATGPGDPTSLFKGGGLLTAKPSTTQSPLPATELFTLNFTLTNLQYTPDLGNPGSPKFTSTQKIMLHYMDFLLTNSSIGPAYTDCKIMAFRSVMNRDDTGVDAVCSYRNDPTAPTFDRVKVYRELSSMTKNITQLGPYNLDKKSLYVNEGFLGRSTLSPTIPQNPTDAHFSLNFTLTNLRYTPDLAIPGSPKFNSTEKIMLYYIDPLVRNSSIGPDFSGCKVMAFRSVMNRDDTGIDAVCSYRNDPTAPRFDRVKVYRELSSMMKNITKLGPYNLDKKSLYVNEGFLGRSTLSPTIPQNPTDAHFSLNFTLTNLRYTPDLAIPGSPKFNSTEKIMLYYIDPLVRNSSIGPDFSGCKVMAFRSVMNRDDTGIDAVCSYRNDPTAPRFDRVKVYRELSSMMKNITKLGPYNLDKKSLYVNGYNEALLEPSNSFLTALSPTIPQNPTDAHFSLNFTLTNLRYTPDLAIPGSPKFNSTEKIMLYYINPLVKNSSIGPAFSGCKVMAFRSVNNKDDTGIDAICSYKTSPPVTLLDRVKLYHELSGMSMGTTKLGAYTMEKNSLYVNGKPPERTSRNVGYQFNFRIINANLSDTNPSSEFYQALQKDITTKMNQLYTKSNLTDRFLFCNVTGLRIGSVVVDCHCFFTSATSFSQESVLSAFQAGTKNVSAQWLEGRYQLQNATVTVLEPEIKPATRPPVSAQQETFKLNFTITNLNYTSDLNQPTSDLHQKHKQNIEKEVKFCGSANGS
uniref:SEA domain-containing protein n=1 Tax=Pelodiscus sinensis TaxID=13735 RepID=K7FBE6_PELSI